MEEMSYTGYLLMFCIMSFSLILCTILFQQDKRIKTYRLSELTKDRKKKYLMYTINKRL